ncbi:FtsW/RodA/SpoVE family cell cycle protein [Candidatus Amarolinea dominans]|uniref:FtsW/RodA/SpoVE family cell cycle protein n=1 Tax=Candidatus Amarolinea dominans TaxID=3140696 RepID=UPI0031CCCB45
MKTAKNVALLDYGLLVLTATLIGIGFIMIFSSSYQQSVMRFELSPTYFAQRQLQWIVVGTVAMLACALVNYHLLERYATPLLGTILLLLVAVLLFGEDIYGARRTLAGGSVQPGEAAKLIMIIYASAWLTSKGEKIKLISYGLLPFSVVLGIVAGLIILEPNLSTALLITITAMTMFFIAGATLRQVIVCVAIFLLTCGLLFTRYPHARERITQMISAGGDPSQGTNEQAQQFGDAFKNGGLLGRGLGNGDLKTNMPLPWTDGIVSVIGEEFGLPGTLFVVALYLGLTFRGLRIASQAADGFGFLLAFGITIWLVYQAIVHVAAATGLGPLTGVTLPFVSYGGSSLVINMSAIGILMSIAQGTGQGKNWKGAAVNARFDFWRGYGRPRLSGPRRLPGTASTTRRRTGGRHIPRPAPRGAVISSGRAAPRSAAVSGGRAAPRRAAPRRQLAAAARLFGRRRPLRRQ